MSTAIRDTDRFAAEPFCDDSDEALLRAFVSDRDDLVFAKLVTRHAELVMGVCRRVLGNEQDAEDAFQATFLVLARKAASLRNGKSLPAWLHKTAHRIALRARTKQARRHEQSLENEAMVEDHQTLQRITTEHSRSALDEELNRLPARYRLPLFLCCIEGKSRDEAARQLGWSSGSLKGRLERGRQLLRQRLVLRGVSLSVAAIFLMRSQAAAQASVPPSLIVSTVQAGIRYAAGESPVGYVSPHALSLANWSLQAMSITFFKVAACSVLAFGALTLGNHWLAIPAAADASDNRIVVVAPIDTVEPEITFVAFLDDEREEGERREAAERREAQAREQREREARERAEGREREQRDAGERREPSGELRERLEQLKRRHAELREAGKIEEAQAVEREAKQLLERISASQRPGGEARELPGELRERLEQLRRRHAELREAGKVDEAQAVEREAKQLLERFNASQREGGDRREGEVAQRLNHLRAAVEHLRAAGLNDLAAQAAEQIGRMERELGQRREVERREGENRERSEIERREGEARERREGEARERERNEQREREERRERENRPEVE